MDQEEKKRVDALEKQKADEADRLAREKMENEEKERLRLLEIAQSRAKFIPIQKALSSACSRTFKDPWNNNKSNTVTAQRKKIPSTIQQYFTKALNTTAVSDESISEEDLKKFEESRGILEKVLQSCDSSLDQQVAQYFRDKFKTQNLKKVGEFLSQQSGNHGDATMAYFVARFTEWKQRSEVVLQGDNNDHNDVVKEITTLFNEYNELVEKFESAKSDILQKQQNEYTEQRQAVDVLLQQLNVIINSIPTNQVDMQDDDDNNDDGSGGGSETPLSLEQWISKQQSETNATFSVQKEKLHPLLILLVGDAEWLNTETQKPDERQQRHLLDHLPDKIETHANIMILYSHLQQSIAESQKEIENANHMAEFIELYKTEIVPLVERVNRFFVTYGNVKTEYEKHYPPNSAINDGLRSYERLTPYLIDLEQTNRSGMVQITRDKVIPQIKNWIGQTLEPVGPIMESHLRTAFYSNIQTRLNIIKWFISSGIIDTKTFLGPIENMESRLNELAQQPDSRFIIEALPHAHLQLFEIENRVALSIAHNIREWISLFRTEQNIMEIQAQIGPMATKLETATTSSDAGNIQQILTSVQSELPPIRLTLMKGVLQYYEGLLCQQFTLPDNILTTIRDILAPTGKLTEILGGAKDDLENVALHYFKTNSGEYLQKHAERIIAAETPFVRFIIKTFSQLHYTKSLLKDGENFGDLNRNIQTVAERYSITTTDTDQIDSLYNLTHLFYPGKESPLVWEINTMFDYVSKTLHSCIEYNVSFQTDNDANMFGGGTTAGVGICGGESVEFQNSLLFIDSRTNEIYRTLKMISFIVDKLKGLLYNNTPLHSIIRTLNGFNTNVEEKILLLTDFLIDDLLETYNIPIEIIGSAVYDRQREEYIQSKTYKPISPAITTTYGPHVSEINTLYMNMCMELRALLKQ